ncbi:MAG TPA: HIRAN domain-containing protein [Burkholderiales bacterium]|nr:HIRAN domain-containing protein [Burkholderiales bacterium]
MILLRSPFAAILLAAALCAAPIVAYAQASIIVQQSPLAGFQFYDGKALWDDMKSGDMLTLIRERDNPHDANAVRIEWNGNRLGYIPRRENADVARQMDRGALVKARIVKLTQARDPWQRVLFEVYVDL